MILRRAEPADRQQLARIQVDSYRSAYAGILPPAYLAHFTYEEQTQDWHDLIAADPGLLLYVADAGDGILAGYGLGEVPASGLDPYDGELVALHVRSTFQRRGIGTRLFNAVRGAFADRGQRSLFLWVLADNPACQFYENLGGVLVGRRPWANNTYFGTDLSEVAYGWQGFVDDTAQWG